MTIMAEGKGRYRNSPAGGVCWGEKPSGKDLIDIFNG